LEYGKLTIGDKIKSLRIAKGVAQEDLAHNLMQHASTLSRIERGVLECPNELLYEIKKALNVEGLPFNESERQAFRDKLYDWGNVISEREIDEAKKIQLKLSVITYLPADKELNMLYGLLNCRLLLVLNELDEATQIIDAMEAAASEMDTICLYYHYRNCGTWHYKNAQYDIALGFYTKAFDLPARELANRVTRYYAIACCYFRMGLVSRCITFLERAREEGSDDHNTFHEYYVDWLLAISYIYTDKLQRAKVLLEKCKKTARRDNNRKYMGDYLVNMGLMYRKAKKWPLALDYLDDAFNYLTKGDESYIDVIYEKCYCLLEMDYFSACIELADEGKKLVDEKIVGYKDYLTLFEAIKCLASLNHSDSVKYIETVAIPHLIEKKCLWIAVDYCALIIEYYTNKKSRHNGVISRFKAIAFDAYKILHEGGVL